MNARMMMLVLMMMGPAACAVDGAVAEAAQDDSPDAPPEAATELAAIETSGPEPAMDAALDVAVEAEAVADVGCTSGTQDCEGDRISQCISGTWEVVEAACQFGCSDGHCNACTPGTKRCVGGHGGIDAAELCAANGAGWQPLSNCPLACRDDGQCEPCHAGDWQCWSGKMDSSFTMTLARCDAGLWTPVATVGMATCFCHQDSDQGAVLMRFGGTGATVDDVPTDCWACVQPAAPDQLPVGCFAL